ncbi:MAG: Sec-independent protein translocase protein TatB [Zoogloeaceae bacterium]|jgi:sec-independent protein translocase protein TatB|nr:Sec-independent protein translocase protein TatB [Zoogloeaceae bacterium]
MFDIGFSELIVVGVVALVVVGPERLPKVARTVGHLLGRMQRYVNEVKSDLSREMELDELRKLQSQVMASAHELEASVQQEIDSARSAFDVQSALTTSVDTPPDIPENQESAPPVPPPAIVKTIPSDTSPVDQTRPVA